MLNKARRLLPVVTFFVIAFTVDQFTGQRYSSVWGSAAIIASAVNLFPAIRPALAAFGGFTAIWEVFNLALAGWGVSRMWARKWRKWPGERCP